VTSRATVAGDDRIRLFLALELPDEVVVELGRWGERHLSRGRRLESFHVTLAFLGSQPRAALDGIVEILCREAARTEPVELEPLRYRETRSVGMVVLADRGGAATSLADRVQRGLERLGVYEREPRPWLPHVTVLRFRERPRLEPPLPPLGCFAPSGAAALLSRLLPSGAQYEVLESCSLGSAGKGSGGKGSGGKGSGGKGSVVEKPDYRELGVEGG
jgi:2'-5' RNA ligase